MPSVFTHQPTFTSAELTLRSPRPEDAEALLPEAQGYFRGQAVVTKCWPYAGVRQKALEDFGFVLDERPIIGTDGTAYGDCWRLGSRNG